MATTVQSLFGMTPEALQAQRAAQLDEQALRFAQMTPMQRAQMGLFRAGSQFGTGLAGLMGAKDPEMERIKARQGLLGGLDMNDPEALRRAAQSIQATDPLAAQELMAKANELSLSLAQIGAERAKATEAQAKMEQEQVAYAMRFQALKTRNPDMSDEEARGIAADPVAFREALKETTIKFSTDAEEVSAELFNKSYSALTPKERAQVNALRAERDRANRAAGATRMPIINAPVLKQGADAIGLVSKYEDLTKPDRELMKSAESAKRLVSEAIASNNTVSWEAARTTLARAAGEGKLSNEDIRRTGVDPRLVQGALDWVNKKIEGVPNADIMRQLATVAAILERQAVDRINATSERVRSTARISGIPEAEYDTLFPMMNSSTATRATTPGSGNVVDFNDLQ